MNGASVVARAVLPPPAELDVFTCPLDGINQIEASAGTGKTWNICALYVRLLLKRDLNADQILVVTFTKAATAELHERIRTRLAELARAIETGEPGSDAFIACLLETVLAGADETALEQAGRRIARALSTFDQAAIHTIHAFCQRALQEAPFAAAMPFALELEGDDAGLRFELAAQFWRTHVEPVAAAHPAFAAWLVAHGAGPLVLDAQLMRRLKKPLAVLRFGALGATDPSTQANAEADADERQMRAHFDEACALWDTEHARIAQLLDDAQGTLSRTTHKPETVAAALDAWARYFAEGDCHAAPPRAALKLTASALQKATKAKFVSPTHPFFALADALAAAVDAAEAAHRRRWLALVADWLQMGPAMLAAAKRARRTVSFDDLLSNLHDALVAHPWLAEVLRARYPAALIDEFQDTDPLQFAIFERIFARGASGPAPVFLVGDPKQAIYSFRAADLHTYLAARAVASARYTLAVNQRSTAPMVEACNRVFSANPQAFVLEGLDYLPVRAGTRERPSFVDGIETGEAGALRVWMLPSGEATLAKRDAQRQAAEASAAEIVRLLRGAREQTVRLGDRPLAPADIAVLVRTHRQGSLVKRVLAAWGVGSVELAQASVFATIDAAQLERVLLAIDMPGDLRRLRAALAADWFGLDAVALASFEAPADAATAARLAIDATDWVERFARYRSVWHERGFATMWRTLMRELGIGLRLIAGRDGERRLTDVNHLAELVAEHTSTHPGIAPTLRWLAAQRVQGGGDDAQLRLESDRDLVQIVTVHKSKGLEYAVVFCPFLNDGATPPSSRGSLPDACEYHETQASGGAAAVLHYGCEGQDLDNAEREARREEAAERARLIYVALTRAIYRCYLVAGPYLSSRSTKESRRSVLNWFVAGDGETASFDDWYGEPPDDTVVTQGWQALAGGSVSLEPLPVLAGRAPLERESLQRRQFAARTSQRLVTETWRIASFSSLASGALRSTPGAVEDEPRPDHDAQAVLDAPLSAPDAESLEPFASSTDRPAVVVSDANADDILDFPRGAAAGECLHRLFELADYAAPASWPQAIQRALAERPVPANAQTAHRMPAMMARMLGDVTSQDLAPGLSLAALDHERRFVEWPFLFACPTLDLAALRRLLVAHGYPDIALEMGALSGFVKGFVDMIVEHEGRYWIIDWKSNHLGIEPGDYGAASLERAMSAHAYHLQALLYTVALHRYLKARKLGYDYDTHVGGYLYVFLRGVRPGWLDGEGPAGVYRRLPARALVEALDTLFGAGGDA